MRIDCERIEAERFAGSDIEELEIAASVREIGDAAFLGCDKLKKIIFYQHADNCSKIELSLERIGDGAFADCIALTEFEFPDSLKSIGELAFSGSGITGAVLGERLEKIGDMAFFNCRSLEYVSVPSPNTNIGKSAFGSCPNLKQGYIAPPFPASGTAAEKLLYAILWCTDNAYADLNNSCADSDNAKAVAGYIMDNRDLLMMRIIDSDNVKAVRGLAAKADGLLISSISAGMDDYLARCNISGNKEMRAALMQLQSRQSAAKTHDIFDDLKL